MKKFFERKIRRKLEENHVNISNLKFLAGDASNRKYFDLIQGRKKNK